MTVYKYSRQIPSTLEEVDQEVSRILSELDAQLGSYNRFSLDLILREALNNAVIHGNKSDPSLVIFISLMLVGDWFHIRIEDQGQGFDWTQRFETEISPNLEHGRGIPIIRHYGEEVVLNDKGNQISLKIALHAPGE